MVMRSGIFFLTGVNRLYLSENNPPITEKRSNEQEKQGTKNIESFPRQFDVYGNWNDVNYCDKLSIRVFGM